MNFNEELLKFLRNHVLVLNIEAVPIDVDTPEKERPIVKVRAEDMKPESEYSFYYLTKDGLTEDRYFRFINFDHDYKLAVGMLINPEEHHGEYRSFKLCNMTNIVLYNKDENEKDVNNDPPF